MSKFQMWKEARYGHADIKIDPSSRAVICPARPTFWAFKWHKWTKDFKIKYSKVHFVELLRCRYCGNYMQVEFVVNTARNGRKEFTRANRYIPIEEYDKVVKGVDSQANEQKD